MSRDAWLAIVLVLTGMLTSCAELERFLPPGRPGDPQANGSPEGTAGNGDHTEDPPAGEPPKRESASETEPNDTASQASQTIVGAAVAGAVGGDKDGTADWFRFQVQVEGEVWAVLTNNLSKGTIGSVGGRIFNSSQRELTHWWHWCQPTGTAETGKFLAEPGVEYFVQVIPNDGAYRTTYLLEVKQSK